MDWLHSLEHVTYTVAAGSKATPTLSTDCNSAPSMITLAPGSWVSDWSERTIGQTEKVYSKSCLSQIIPYNCSKYGNPIRLYYGDIFKPYFANYLAGKFSSYVSKDIAIWEDYGQSSFSFNTTQAAAGCVKDSQFVTDFISNTTSDISDIWNPSVYF